LSEIILPLKMLKMQDFELATNISLEILTILTMAQLPVAVEQQEVITN
jgi:hypothetical protein